MMLRVPLKRTLLRNVNCCARLQHRPILRKAGQSLLSKSILAQKPTLFIIPSTVLSSAAPFYLQRSPEKEFTRLNSNEHPATPQEIEIDKANYESKYAIVRLCCRIFKFVDDWILEPLLTMRRLAHILILFTPVVITAPIVYFGKYDTTEGESSGTLLWFDFLSKQMERAGPTFIKVSSTHAGIRLEGREWLTTILLIVGTVDSITYRSISSCSLRKVIQAPFQRQSSPV